MPFVVPTQLGTEAEAAAAAIRAGRFASDGFHTRALQSELARRCAVDTALLTSSATDALTVAAMVLDIGPGDEVIVPSYTFVSTAVAFAARGATVAFADIDEHSLCVDAASAARLVTDRTRAIVPVHYAGSPADMDGVVTLARDAGIAVIEDNAHGFGGTWRGHPLGSLGDLGVLSFDYAKNIQSGEGGALLVSDPELEARAQVAIAKGTNRAEFLAGRVPGYDWVGLGGHFRPPDYVAAVLGAQLEQADGIQKRRKALWANYATELASWAADRGVRLPEVADSGTSTHHLYWIVLPSAQQRESFTTWMRDAGIDALTHYTSLARSPAASRFARDVGTPISDHVAQCLVRLPLHHALTEEDQTYVIDRARSWELGSQRKAAL